MQAALLPLVQAARYVVNSSFHEHPEFQQHLGLGEGDVIDLAGV
jgi:hypothetical protein